MKRIFIFLLTLIIVLVQAETWTVIFASDNIPLECAANQYSVDRITGKDQFTKLACYNENQFQQAYDFMTTQAATTPNVVIRHVESPSPMNIVASDRSMAYSQNYTYLKADTITIYKDKALTIPATYINQSNPLYYYKTEISTKASTETIKPTDLVAEVEINGARGYIKVTAIDIIPLIYVENRVNNWYISFFTRNFEDVYTDHNIKPNITQYIVYSISNTTKTGSVTLKQIKVQVDTALYSNSYDYGIAPDWLPIGTYYSPNGITFYTDMDLKNPVMNSGQVGKYYNYYDYINLRTKTSYTGLELDDYFMYFASLNPTYSSIDIKTSVLYPYNTDNSKRDVGNLFVNAQNTYGMNALMIYAMALHESGYGTSGYARLRNNLFGWGAFDSDPDNAYTFPNIAVGINEHMGINLRYYLDATNVSTPLSRFYASNIGNKGAGINTRYASDPWWSVKIAGIAFRIDRYLGLKDFDNYQLSILGDTRTFYKDRNLQNTAYTIDNRATNYPVIISSSYNNTYYTQSSNPIVNGNIVTSSTTGLVEYNWDNSKVYLNNSQTTLVNTPKTPVTIVTDTDDLLYDIERFEWINETTIYIKGLGILDNTAMPDVSATKHTIILKNAKSNIEYPFEMNVIEGSFNNYNNLVYNSVRYDGNIDISGLPDGSYYYMLKTEYGDTNGFSRLSDPAYNPIMPDINIQSNRMYKTVMDNWNFMEYQLIIQSDLPDLVVNAKLPTEYMSVVQLYDYVLTEDNLLQLNGLGYINSVSMTDVDEKQVKLILINSLNNGEIYTFDMLSHNQGFDPSIDGFDYSYSWFKNDNIDLSLLPDGEYKIYIYLKSGTNSDFAEIRDFSFKEDLSINNATRTVQFKLSNTRREYSLIISTN